MNIRHSNLFFYPDGMESTGLTCWEILGETDMLKCYDDLFL